MARTMPIPRETRKKSNAAMVKFRQNLLGWYDRHARTLPWRATGGKTPDPYHVWLSEVMLQQTTVQAVIPYFGKFVDKWPRVDDLAKARDDDVMQAWAGLGYYARARNLLKCARAVVADHKSVFPNSLEGLKGLPGIGDYTAAAIASIAFNQVATVIDGNVDRVVSRWFAIETPLPDSKPEIRALAATLFDWPGAERPGDFAQAMMDLGATICTPKSPKCGICPVATGCKARETGIADQLPRRKAKTAQPRRAGHIYWVRNKNSEILFETRPDKGLLGGMAGLPTSDWVNWTVGRKKWPEIPAGQNDLIGHIHTAGTIGDKTLMIRHTFTHFDLELRGVVMDAPPGFKPGERQFWVPMDEISALGLPTVFKKFVRLMMHN